MQVLVAGYRYRQWFSLQFFFLLLFLLFIHVFLLLHRISGELWPKNMEDNANPELNRTEYRFKPRIDSQQTKKLCKNIHS